MTVSARSHGGRLLTRYRIALLVVLVVVAALVAVAAAAVATGSATTADDSMTTAWQTNAAGQTYGSAAIAQSHDDWPDLVAAEATNGKTGYVRTSDLRGETPSTPEEIEACNAANLAGREIPVYEVDGITEVGVFTIGGPGAELTVTNPDGTATTKIYNPDGTTTTRITAADGSVTETTE